MFHLETPAFVFGRLTETPLYWKLNFRSLFVCLFELLAKVPAFTFHKFNAINLTHCNDSAIIP